MEFDLSELFDNNTFSIEDYQYLDQLLNHRTIIFNEEASASLIEKVFLPLKNFEEDNSILPITLILNSPGGSVADSFFLAHYLTHYKKPLKIIVCGYACSMATIILAAGGKNSNITRTCYPSSFALIHDGFMAIPASETKTAVDIVQFNEKVDKDIRQFILDNTNINSELYDSKARHQWYLSSEEMKEYGLIDEIL